ncbi:MAG: queuosine precursor transporter [Anaerolineae bacterium]|nr:queuosine precursor transporter [Anaerolineae bacterium]MDW8102533.1 queuosine precursor transporter [Anaerolineae bacterium]
MERSYRFFDFIMALFVAVLIISNIASSKILILGPFTFDGGTILFPISYIFGDILTEVYGYRRSRRVIWTGFFCTALMALTLSIVGALPPAPGWENQEAYEKILGMTPRIVLGSLIAYWAGEFSNSYTLAKLKILTRGRWLWTRTISSTLVGQGVDTILFCLIAFAGALPWGLLGSVILSNYVFKCGVEAFMTPVTYKVVNFLKKAENEDYYDYDTDFNPFKLEA